jgi:TonB family protein
VPITRVPLRSPRDHGAITTPQGEIIVEVIVTTEGNVRDAKVVKGNNPRLIDPALSAAKQWRYKPALCDGTPVEMVVYIYSQVWIR